MAKKTIQVERVLEIANNYLACTGLTAETKQGVYQVIQRVLHETGNYAGFMYLNLTDDHRPYLLKEDGSFDRLNPEWSDNDENSRVYLYSRLMKQEADRKVARLEQTSARVVGRL
jgi:hypothetical protein